jgi:hypothetical protein
MLHTGFARCARRLTPPLTAARGGRNLKTVIAELKKYLPGWKEYFQLADTPTVFADHDK